MMIQKKSYYLIVGLGRSGLATARWLSAHGYGVWAWDDNGALREKSLCDAIEIKDPLGEDFPWREVSAIILSPGIPLKYPLPHPVLLRALEMAPEVEIISDLELFCRFKKKTVPIIGVTGTNGKSTTTACIGFILQNTGFKVSVAGNIGVPVFSFDPEDACDGYVWEVSSYQLEAMPSFHPAISVITNLTPDHLDRYENLSHYYETKEAILASMTDQDWLVIGIDSEASYRLFEKVKASKKCQVFPVSVSEETTEDVKAHGWGIYKDNDTAFMRLPKERGIKHLEQQPSVVRLFGYGDHRTLKGVHNVQNRACAFAATFLWGAPIEAVLRAMEKFEGLPHRSELIGQSGRIQFINDSKATNIDAAIKSLGAYKNIYWIAGGLHKGDDITQVYPLLGNVKKAFLIGHSMDIFEKALKDRVPCTRSGSLERATIDAFFASVSDSAEGSLDEGPVVLLSPGCASFDQFKDFEHRGNQFREIVSRLCDSFKDRGSL